MAPGGRVFDVALQGQTVLTGFDVAAEAGGPRRMVVREFQGIQAKADVTVTLTAKAGKPILCGVELVREKIDE